MADYRAGARQGLEGVNEFLVVTPDSLAQALQTMQQLLEDQGYQVAERTATMFTTKSKYVQAGVEVARHWFFFRHWKPAPNPPVSFRLRVRAFALPTGTQLQVAGVYIHEGCAECLGEECPGQGMQHNEQRPTTRPYIGPGHRVLVPFGTWWAEACYEEALSVARHYQPGTLYLLQVNRYTTTGAAAW